MDLVWILLAVLLFLAVMLAVPLEWVFTLRYEQGKRKSDSQIRWLFGLVRFKTTGSHDADTVNKPDKRKKHRAKRRRSSPLAAVSVEGFAERLLTLLRRLLSSIHIRHLNVQARIGLGDAADTGRLWALVGPLSALLAMPRGAWVYIEPDFTETVLDLKSNGRLRVVPLQVMTLLLVFLLSINTMRALHAIRSGGQ